MALTAIDLFAGAGGFSLAALAAGFEIRAAVEIDKHAVATYRHSVFPRCPREPYLADSDIRTISWRDFLNRSQLTVGECDLLLGGPPCQGFSTHRINDAGVNDPRNELLLSYFSAVKAIRPKCFLVENVSGLLWPRHKSYLAEFLSRARNSGYRVHPPVLLNARDYGVPQNRKRVFILGVRRDAGIGEVVWPPPSTHAAPQSDEVKAGFKQPWQTARAVFKVALSKSDPNSRYMRSSLELRKVFAKTPKNGGSRGQSQRILTCHKNHDGHKDVYGRIDPTKPGPTMTSGCINPSKGRFVHPTADHAITARHAARFQSFPDDFVFLGGLTAAGHQIGNAVPPLMGQILTKAIASALAPLGIPLPGEAAVLGASGWPGEDERNPQPHG